MFLYQIRPDQTDDNELARTGTPFGGVIISFPSLYSFKNTHLSRTFRGNHSFAQVNFGILFR